MATATTLSTPNRPGMLASVCTAGVSAVITVNFTHPIETCKTRLQATGTFSPAMMIKSEGVGALWKGIKPAYGREALYTSFKIGGYAPIRDALGAGGEAPFYLKLASGFVCGAIGSAIGNPFDVMKTLMQTNSTRGVIPLSTLAGEMYAEQGVKGFYRGVQANVMRAAVLTSTKMAAYDEVKGLITRKFGWERKDMRTVTCSAIVAGFLMTCTAAPFDMMRTKLMNQPPDRQIYSGFLDCGRKVLQAEGPFAFYRGFLPMWARFAPSTVLQLGFYEFGLSLAGYDSV